MDFIGDRGLFLCSLAGGLLFYLLILPVQDRLGLNLVAVLEPYLLWNGQLKIVQMLNAFVLPYLLLPFYVTLGFFLSRNLIRKAGSAFRVGGNGPGR